MGEILMQAFPSADGRYTEQYTLFDEMGQSAVILSYGCTVQSVRVRGRDGELTDVALGYDTLEQYQQNGGYFGATVGRVANRIDRGRFTLNGKNYQLPLNDGEHSLHGGKVGFDRQNWRSTIEGDALVATLTSPDGDQGYPGCLTVTVTVRFTGGRLRMDYRYRSDADTVVNLTNHCYFNLNGAGDGDILSHVMQIYADGYCETDSGSIPRSAPVSVEGTPFDFRTPKPIGRDLKEGHPQTLLAGGYDHNFALQKRADGVSLVAVGDKSGVRLTQSTDYPGVQFYTGNVIGPGDVGGKDGKTYRRHDGFCVEAQQFPNAVNVAAYPSAVLPAGKEETHWIEFAFDTVD